jgi:hypothetical protein
VSVTSESSLIGLRPDSTFRALCRTATMMASYTVLGCFLLLGCVDGGAVDDRGRVNSAMTLFWCVADVQPGETLMCGVGQPFGAENTMANLTFRITPMATDSTAPTALVVPATLSPSGGAASALIPETAPRGVYTVQLASTAPGGSSGGSWVSNEFVPISARSPPAPHCVAAHSFLRAKYWTKVVAVGFPPLALVCCPR